ncbi:carbohydrate kinase family protein [Dactylosporangium roseum]|uniref:Carbohydrate kinase family protein n=1 Tax=Dactylosporangium roseum TaxID=47989 RepID=A0ABY5ZCJ7_9ACTN|nr:carbohydrate kinase family protein [Dactylosporangium roseum]UWZ39142.1 carbohydrate kinase family protein [Dactylosporangium roseum]
MITVGCVGGLTLDWVRSTAGTSGPFVGGNALYSAVGAWLTGARPSICAVVGADFPADVLGRLADHGFDISAVRQVPGPSFQVLLDDSGPRRQVSYLPSSGHNDTLDPEVGQLRDDWNAAHLAAIPTSSQERLAAGLTRRRIPYTLDTIVIPGEIEPDVDALLALASRSGCFLPSREELDHLWPDTTPKDQVLRLVAATGTPAVVTCGALGSIGFDGHRLVHVPAYQGTVVDTTGAGDAYSGAYAAALARGADLAEGMAAAAAAASLVIEVHGADQLLTPDRQQTARRRAECLRQITTEEKPYVVER